MRTAEASRRRAATIVAAMAVLGVVFVAAAFLTAGGADASADKPAIPSAAIPVEVAEEPTPPAPAETPPPPAEPAPEPEPGKEPVAEPADEQEKASADEPTTEAPAKETRKKSGTVQRISIAIGYAGYEPTVARAKAGVPIKLTVGKGEGCAAGFLMPSLGVSLDNSGGPATTKLGALEAGEYPFFCGMQMIGGVLEVR